MFAVMLIKYNYIQLVKNIENILLNRENKQKYTFIQYTKILSSNTSCNYSQ